MKIVEQDRYTTIYPFARKGGPVELEICPITIYPGGSIQLGLPSRQLGMDAKRAKALGEALLHAVERAKKGQKER